MENKPAHDRLVIDKKAIQPTQLHYSREARLAMRNSIPAPGTKGLKGFLKKNKGLSILLVNILLLALIIAGAGYLLTNTPPAAKIPGYEITMHAFRTSEKIVGFVTIKITTPANANNTAYVTFRLKNTGTEVVKSLVLENTGEMEIQAALPAAQADKSIEAVVTIGDRTLTLSKRL
jgi:hypothetical protein